jgi:hypothetical protein
MREMLRREGRPKGLRDDSAGTLLERSTAMKKLINTFKQARAISRNEEGHAAAWGGGGLLTIILVVVLLVLIF